MDAQELEKFYYMLMPDKENTVQYFALPPL